jgi:hypothetical protein
VPSRCRARRIAAFLEGIDDELVAEQGLAAPFELRARLLELLDFASVSVVLLATPRPPAA